jgi:uncharacterized protein YqeY
MTLKEKIQNDFIIALKAKDENAKAALSSIKSKITEAEKANGNKELDDKEVLKVVTKAIKQREESLKIFTDAGRDELARKEADEASILRNYLPAQMSEEELYAEACKIVEELRATSPSSAALIGKSTGMFNKRFQGMAEPAAIISAVTKAVNA